MVGPRAGGGERSGGGGSQGERPNKRHAIFFRPGYYPDPCRNARLGFRFEDAGVADQTRTAGMECGHELSRTIDRFDRSTTTSASRAVSTSKSANIVSALCARFAEPRRVDLRDVRGPRQGRRLGQQSSQPHSGTPVGSAGPLAAQLHRRHGPEAGPLPCISARIWVVPFIQRPQVARRALRHGHWARPEPAVTLDQRQVGAETFVENRHAFDDSAWQGALPDCPLAGPQFDGDDDSDAADSTA